MNKRSLKNTPKTGVDYYPFGMTMSGRSWSQNQDYRFGFQGQEQDQEYYSGAVSYKYRIHDPRIGRFLSIDPLAPEYPHNSTYAFSENVVINAVELEGLEKKLLFVSGPENPSEGQSAEVTHGAHLNKDGLITSTGVHNSVAVYHGGSDSYGAGWYSPDDYMAILGGIGTKHGKGYDSHPDHRASAKLDALSEFHATEFVPNFFQDYFPITEYAVDHAGNASARGNAESIAIMDLLPAGMFNATLARLARLSLRSTGPKKFLLFPKSTYLPNELRNLKNLKRKPGEYLAYGGHGHPGITGISTRNTLFNFSYLEKTILRNIPKEKLDSGITLRIAACHCGANGNALKLSLRYPNSRFIAPTNKLHTQKYSGMMYIEKGGVWRTYQNGIEIESVVGY